MPARKLNLNKLNKKEINFIFKGHPPGEKYSNRRFAPRDIKTLVYEDISGQRDLDVSKWATPDKFQKSRQKYIARSQKRGVVAVSGESTSHIDQLEQTRFNRAVSNPTINNIKTYFNAYASKTQGRHEEIIDTIMSFPKPMEISYGTAHSILSRELRQNKIVSSRDVKPIVFTLEDALLRKLIIGREPTDVEYKRAFISLILYKSINDKLLLGDALTNKQLDLNSIVRFVLVGKLTETQLNNILQSGDYERVFLYNKLSSNATYQQLVDFVDVNAGYFKKYLTNIKTRKGTKKE